MIYWILRAINYTAVISVIFSIVRWKSIEKNYVPVVLFMWIALLDEVVSDISIYFFRTNAPNTNVYLLLSTLVIVYQLKVWGAIRLKRGFAYLCVLTFVLLWGYENFIYSSVWNFNSYTAILFYLLIVILSVRTLGQNIASNEKYQINRVVFLICMAFIIKYTSSIIIELFWIYGLTSSSIFLRSVYRLTTYVNLLVNIFYAIAVLWIPKKREYTWLSR